MDSINQNLGRTERLAVGTAFAQEILSIYPEIESVYVFGSIVRGDNLPASDLDMHYVMPRNAGPLPLDKAVRHGVFIDIEAYAKEDLTPHAVLSDAYIFGLISDCIVLFDRTGYMTNLKQMVMQDDTPERALARISKLAEPVLRNLRGFTTAIDTMNYPEICKCSGFVMWCLADYLLAKSGTSAGGFRTLSRLKAVNTDAFLDILKLQDSMDLSAGKLRSYNDFSSAWWNQEKSEWMFRNGFKDEAFHTLWICLGLEVKGIGSDTSSEKARQLTTRCRGWLDRLGWNAESTLRGKATEMARVTAEYVT